VELLLQIVQERPEKQVKLVRLNQTDRGFARHGRFRIGGVNPCRTSGSENAMPTG
jgi:hypothetical protein